MKRIYFIILFILILQHIPGQISHGGTPLFISNESLLKSSQNLFVEMPEFDLKEMLREDSINRMNMRGSFRFAKKFITSIERGYSGENFILPDGSKIWRVGIRSKGAYSINVLFSEFHIPRGSRLFLYNTDHTYIIGSFTSENNSENNILPVRPVYGDEIIVEYIEPADAEFEGKLKITEVNHDYVNLRSREPVNDVSYDFLCMPDTYCENPDNPNNNSTVLLVINGSYFCTGTLLNNTKNDGTAYVLTAAHCINNDLKVVNPSWDYYTSVAGTIVSFFNYQQPVCDQAGKPDLNQDAIKATEEMSIAGAIPQCIHDTIDVALLRLKETPPDYYRPYYAGWNINYSASASSSKQEQFPFINLHHPQGSLTKFGLANKSLQLTTFSTRVYSNRVYNFYPNSHWQVSSWDTGSTAPGSSGSPLFDNQGLLIGGLSGGGSYCNGSASNGKSDSFFALFKGWTFGNNPNLHLKTYLDPLNSGARQHRGLDINKNTPFTRLMNADYNGEDTLVNTTLNSPQTGFLFGHNSLHQSTEFAEEFNIDKSADISGVFILCPAINSGKVSEVKINVYSGENYPEQLLGSQIFYPTYTTYERYDNSMHEATKTMSIYPTESFVKFNDVISVGKKFFISYEITYPSEKEFSVYNLALKQGKPNTAWIKNNSNWKKATEYSYQPMRTSLAIHPLARINSDTNIVNPPETKPASKVSYDRKNQIITIQADPGEKGTFELYSVNGQLLKKGSYSGTSYFSLFLNTPTGVGIVRVISGENIQTDKIIF